MADNDSTRPSLHLVRARFSNFLLKNHYRSSNFTKSPYYTNFKSPYFRIAWCRVTPLGTLVVQRVLCMLIWP